MVEPLKKSDVLWTGNEKNPHFAVIELARVLECVQALKEIVISARGDAERRMRKSTTSSEFNVHRGAEYAFAETIKKIDDWFGGLEK